MADQNFVKFKGISARAWEHPADRAAMATLRRVPFLDMALKKMIHFLGERGLEALYLGNAVRVSDKQFARVNKAYEDCLQILDVQERYPLYVTQTPLVNAGAVGTDKPFIILNSGLVELFTDDELRLIIGHELGHIASDHVLYKTMLSVLLNAWLSTQMLGPFLLIPLPVLIGIILGLKEWDRKAELSCDRAGLLCVQDPRTAYTVEMKMAGGKFADQMDVDEFIAQAQDYEQYGNVLDSVYKIFNLLDRTHPFAVLRLAELKKWVDSGAYGAILKGEYITRDEAANIVEELGDGFKAYGEDARKSQDPLMRIINRVGDLGEKVGRQIRSASGK